MSCNPKSSLCSDFRDSTILNVSVQDTRISACTHRGHSSLSSFRFDRFHNPRNFSVTRYEVLSSNDVQPAISTVSRALPSISSLTKCCIHNSSSRRIHRASIHELAYCLSHPCWLLCPLACRLLEPDSLLRGEPGGNRGLVQRRDLPHRRSL